MEPPAFTDFKRFLLHAPCINKIVAFLSEGVKTRNAFQRQTSSCKFWQLRLMLLYLFGRESNLFSKLLSFCDKQGFGQTAMNLETHAPLQQIKAMIAHINRHIYTPDRKPTYLYSLVGLNSPMVTPPMKTIYSMEDLPMVPYVLYPLCLYVNKPVSDLQSAIGMIAHFFTVFRDETHYYLNSSYGSDYVCIPQQTVTFLPADFTALCALLGKEPVNRTEQDTAILTQLLSAFFLKGGMRKRVNSDTVEEYPALLPEWIMPDQGRKKEMEQIYTVNRYSYSVGWMTAYETELHNVFTAMQQQGGYRKKQIRRTTKKAKTKKRHH